MNKLARKLSEIATPSGRVTAAQAHEATRKAGDLATAIEAVQWATCDLTPEDAVLALIAIIEARPDMTQEHLEALERRVGRMAWAHGRDLASVAREGANP